MPVDNNTLIGPEISPDGKRIAVDRTVQGARDVWLMDLVRGRATRFTFDPGIDGYPVWSPDGTQIVFESNRKGNFDIYVGSSSNPGQERVVLEAPENQWPYDYSKDGKFLLHWDGANASDLWALPLTEKDAKPIPIATTPALEPNGAFSPDTHWVA